MKPDEKSCTKCEQIKPLTDFHRCSKVKSGRYAQCKTCRAEVTKDEYWANRDKHRERKRLANAANPEANRARTREWQKKNPHLVREALLRRYARIFGVPVPEPLDYEAILARDGLWCYLCETEIEQGQHQFDHVIPLVHEDGHHTAENVRVVHALCNQRKGGSTPEEYWARYPIT